MSIFLKEGWDENRFREIVVKFEFPRNVKFRFFFKRKVKFTRKYKNEPNSTVNLFS